MDKQHKNNVMGEVWDEMEDRTGYLYDEVLLTQQHQDELSRLMQHQIRMLARSLITVFDQIETLMQRLKRYENNLCAQSAS